MYWMKQRQKTRTKPRVELIKYTCPSPVILNVLKCVLNVSGRSHNKEKSEKSRSSVDSGVQVNFAQLQPWDSLICLYKYTLIQMIIPRSICVEFSWPVLFIMRLYIITGIHLSHCHLIKINLKSFNVMTFLKARAVWRIKCIMEKFSVCINPVVSVLSDWWLINIKYLTYSTG